MYEIKNRLFTQPTIMAINSTITTNKNNIIMYSRGQSINMTDKFKSGDI